VVFSTPTMRFPATTVRFPTMRRGGGGVRRRVRSSVGLAVMGRGMRLAVMRGRGVRLIVMRDGGTGAGISVIAHEATVISSAPGSDKAMPAPTVVITPAGPWAHAQEDAVVEVARPVITNGGAGIRCIAVVAVRTDGWRTTYGDGNLRIRFWRQGQGRKQSCSTQ
jgi:hypothetical protein